MIAKRTLRTFLSVVAAFVACYFIYHTVQGDRGWFAMLRLQNQVNAAQDSLLQLQQDHKEIGQRVHLMRPGSLDPDLLDEESREMLDYSKPNEIIVLTPQDKMPGVVQRSKDSKN